MAGEEDGGPEHNSGRLHHIHIRTYWMCVVCAHYCLQNMLRGPMYMESKSMWHCLHVLSVDVTYTVLAVTGTVYLIVFKV